MTKELSKPIMEKSKTRNKYLKWLSRENYLSYKKCKNKCNSLTKKANKIFLNEATKDGIMSNKRFWSTVKPFLTNKGYISNDFISVEKDGDLIYAYGFSINTVTFFYSYLKRQKQKN